MFFYFTHFLINTTFITVNDLLLLMEIAGCDFVSNTENQITHVYIKMGLQMSNFNLMELWIDYHLYLHRNPGHPSTIPTQKANKSLTCVFIILTKSPVSWFSHASKKRVLFICLQCCVKCRAFPSRNPM